MYAQMEDIDYEYQESLNQDYEMEYRIKEHILENKKLMDHIRRLDEMDR